MKLLFPLLCLNLFLSSQPFPHRVFSVDDMASSLVDLGLSPGGSLVVKRKELTQPSAVTGQFYQNLKKTLNI